MCCREVDTKDCAARFTDPFLAVFGVPGRLVELDKFAEACRAEGECKVELDERLCGVFGRVVRASAADSAALASSGRVSLVSTELATTLGFADED